MAKSNNFFSRSFRSRIEAHQNKIFRRNAGSSFNLDSSEQHESYLVLSEQGEHLTFSETKAEKEINEFDTSFLFVLDPEDVNELSFDEIDIVWEKRHDLCGSDRALAEIIAIKEILSGIVETYQGWQSYINAPEIQEWRDSKYSTQDKNEIEESRSENITEFLYESEKLKLNDIKGLSLDELKKVWSNRNNSFGSIEAACETLASIRYLTGIDLVKKENENYFLSHPAIKELLDFIPFEREKLNYQSEKEYKNSATIIEKKYSLVRTQLRLGQTEFRSALINNYNSHCCITNCSEIAVLDAAHIRPYSGLHSNTLDNGLLLRSDIHKLYDRFLLSIEPEALTVRLSKNIKDQYYLNLDGARINFGEIPPSRVFLEEHFSTFLRVNESE
ncbi:HNH endonuclease [Paraglaciecola sp.]|uniref:HNH endonuclease n=1 Tax=Paraglaciecola sp. TaxID=1920173 RepID=UPI00273F9E96|nr:HNH endonuclease [Paraglaciecola sp.]MDP5031895.1 HNH endonuclease [Paraglaciecola sp.]